MSSGVSRSLQHYVRQRDSKTELSCFYRSFPPSLSLPLSPSPSLPSSFPFLPSDASLFLPPPCLLPSPALPTVLSLSLPAVISCSLSFPLPHSPSFPSLPLPLPRGSACDDHYHRLRLAPTGRRRLQTKSVHRFYISPVNILFVCRHVSSPYTTNTSSGL